MQDLVTNTTSPEGSPAQKKRKRNSRRVPIDMMLQVQIAAIRQPKEREALKKRLRKQITCCEINEITTSGLTALNQCVLDGNLESAKMLVELGADVNKKDRFGWTALHYAASEGYEAICRYLLRNGANVRAEDKEGKFPVEVTDDELILKLLLRATLLYNMPPLDKDSLQHSCWCVCYYCCFGWSSHYVALLVLEMVLRSYSASGINLAWQRTVRRLKSVTQIFAIQQHRGKKIS